MSSGSPAAEHVLAVLDFLSHGKGPVPAATISRTLGFPVPPPISCSKPCLLGDSPHTFPMTEHGGWG